ncbi:MAG: hypothetical protein ACT4P5_02910 [Armatimonadota bacterium]
MKRFLRCLCAALLVAACARTPRLSLETYTSSVHGFVISRPSSWPRVETDQGRRVWFRPAEGPADESPEAQATEFVVVMSQPADGPLPEGEVRRLAMTLLPMHGVSGFQRTPGSTEAEIWYRFELTGSTRGSEWASLGLLVTGRRRLHYVVCAAPLPSWRERQKLCDDVLRSFKPGDLAQ